LGAPQPANRVVFNHLVDASDGAYIFSDLIGLADVRRVECGNCRDKQPTKAAESSRDFLDHAISKVIGDLPAPSLSAAEPRGARRLP
jgi:hypothetical protein